MVLGTVGTLVAGPIGGALGALVGRQIDGAVFAPTREGPRLQELAVTTSSYGQPIPRHFGRMRAPGTVIWASDIAEHRERSGGKGQPRTTTYSYSVSFAVLLASRPIDGVGRIWADGELLRGEAGDLKVAGTMRLHHGHRDQQPDPLLLAERGDQAPAFRGSAYAVFEDLQLAEFGNRVPALTFEILAGSGAEAIAGVLEPLPRAVADVVRIDDLEGYSHSGGPIGDAIAELAKLAPVAVETAGPLLSVRRLPATGDGAALGEAAAWGGGDFGQKNGWQLAREAPATDPVTALRYYDTARDYQPGLQRIEGRIERGAGRQLELPAALAPDGARRLVEGIADRHGSARERLRWRLAELATAFDPGQLVRAPGHSGRWRVEGWEWREGGVELELVRHVELPDAAAAGDPGTAWRAPDLPIASTVLRVFELPPPSAAAGTERLLYAAVSAGPGKWPGAQLYGVVDNGLVPTVAVASERAVLGRLVTPCGPSAALMLEYEAAIEVELLDAAMELQPAGLAELAGGANRLLVGGEIMQFADARLLEDGSWRLGGLLRGRGGTEEATAVGHAPDTPVTLLDARLTPLADGAGPLASATSFAAIGIADEEPQIAAVENPDLSLVPPPPVHARRVDHPDGHVELRWVRRARGGWRWPDFVDAPMNEGSERYQLGIGSPKRPAWQTDAGEPWLVIARDDWNALTAAYAGGALWVRQIGDNGASRPTLLTRIG
jgi:hypothetical protein